MLLQFVFVSVCLSIFGGLDIGGNWMSTNEIFALYRLEVPEQALDEIHVWDW